MNGIGIASVEGWTGPSGRPRVFVTLADPSPFVLHANGTTDRRRASDAGRHGDPAAEPGLTAPAEKTVARAWLAPSLDRARYGMSLAIGTARCTGEPLTGRSLGLMFPGARDAVDAVAGRHRLADDAYRRSGALGGDTEIDDQGVQRPEPEVVTVPPNGFP